MTPRGLRRFVRPTVIVATAGLVAGVSVGIVSDRGAGPADAASAARDRSLAVERFDADLVVYRSGRVHVTETIRYRFDGSWNGVWRSVPVDYRTPGGFRYDLRLDVKEVTDDAGRKLKVETSREGPYRKLKIWVPDAVDAVRTVVIRYEAERALRFFEEYDELYWNVLGPESPIPVEEIGATVRLPADVTGIRTNAFTGRYGSRESEAEVRVEGPRIRYRASRGLDPYEGFTVAAAWDPGIVDRPTAADRAVFLLRANWPLLLPILAFFFMFRLWSDRGRDPEIRSVAARYEPPPGLTPGEVGVMIDDRPDLRDITATVVDLAVRGYLAIEEVEEKKLLGLLSDRDYIFHLRREREEWADLLPHERKLLRSLFGGDRSIKLSDLENEFYRDLPKLKDGLTESLIRHGVYGRRPDRVRGMYLALALALGLGILALGLGLGGPLRLAPAAVVVAAVLTALVAGGFALIMPARTPAGARLVEKVRGFQEFLERVESDRFRRMITGPEMFEKYLPFAMALGVEKKWAAAFEGMYRTPPEWYRGAVVDGFGPRVFVSDLGRMSARTSAVMSSAPRSSGGSAFGSGGSSFGGGGFSGGGFGGGGTGGF